ncbi:MAG: hypothetical protein Q9213_000190 [Squamulea squamosa]
MDPLIQPKPTPGQVNALMITERVVSVFSIIGILFILVTFYFLSSFNKPINRLVFYASFGNLGMNIACLISEDGILAGEASPLCQFQAFLIQMCDDSACENEANEFADYSNTGFWGWMLSGPAAWPGMFILPSSTNIPIASYVLLISGISWDATAPPLCQLWHSFSSIPEDAGRSMVKRWVAILFAFGIYIKAGRVIYKRRDKLKGFLNPLNENPFTTGVVTTEIDVTIVPADQLSPASGHHGNPFDKVYNGIPGVEEGRPDPYTVNVGVGENEHNKRPSKPELLRVRSITREEAIKENPNPGAWLYARVAFLFFLSMLIIWIPSSVNRVYSLAHPDRINFALNYVSALVLPMQGLLNVFVYVITSQTACRELVHALRGYRTMPWRNLGGKGRGFRGMQGLRGRKGSDTSGRRKSFHVLESRAGTSEVSVPMEAHTSG